MLNKDKRSIALLLALGDGCLHYIKNNGKLYGGLTIDHGIAQADYQKWKAELLSTTFDRDVKVRTGHKGSSVQISLCMKRFRAWRKFTYPNDKKSIPKLLKFIRHPELALAVWLMDDGYVENTSFRLFVCDQNEQELKQIQEWLFENFKVNSTVRWQKKDGKLYPFIKIYTEPSCQIWSRIRVFVLQFKSMRHKFRKIENYYQVKFLQRNPNQKV